MVPVIDPEAPNLDNDRQQAVKSSAKSNLKNNKKSGVINEQPVHDL
jgi:hypothetical protein